MSDSNTRLVHVDDVHFSWPASEHPVLRVQHFSIDKGECVFLQGPSGSGKTTLLSLIAAVLTPQKGNIVIDGVTLNELKGGQRDQFRADRIGLVFQQFNLLPFLSVAENIQLPCRFSTLRRRQATASGVSLKQETERLLLAMHLPIAEVQKKSATQLSVGQQQRVAVARALIGRPSLVIADEPTSALDSETRQAFLDLLFTEVKSAGSTLLFVSHDASLADSFDRHLDLRTINSAAADHDYSGALQ